MEPNETLSTTVPHNAINSNETGDREGDQVRLIVEQSTATPKRLCCSNVDRTYVIVLGVIIAIAILIFILL